MEAAPIVAGSFGGPRTACAVVYSPFPGDGGAEYRVRGWELSHFRRHPVLLERHDPRSIVGRVLAIEAVRLPRLQWPLLVAGIEFAPTDRGRRSFELARRRLLEFSAGFVSFSDVGLLYEVSAVPARGFGASLGGRVLTGVLWCSPRDDGARLWTREWLWAANCEDRDEWRREYARAVVATGKIAARSVVAAVTRSVVRSAARRSELGCPRPDLQDLRARLTPSSGMSPAIAGRTHRG